MARRYEFYVRVARRSPKILQNLSKGQTNVAEHFPKSSEDTRRLPKTFEEDPKMFRSYTNEFKNLNLRDKLDHHATRVPDVVSYEFYEWCIFQ